MLRLRVVHRPPPPGELPPKRAHRPRTHGARAHGGDGDGGGGGVGNQEGELDKGKPAFKLPVTVYEFGGGSGGWAALKVSACA